jgi:hypothetical protein
MLLADIDLAVLFTEQSPYSQSSELLNSRFSR